MWNSLTLTGVAGTAQRFAAVPTLAQRLVVTPLVGAGSALIYLLNQDPATVMAAKTAQNFVTELGPATATVPGVPFVINRLFSGPPINVQEYGVDFSHTGDQVQIAWEL